MATSDTVGAIDSLVITGASTFFTAKILSFNLGRSVPIIDRTPADRTTGGMTADVGRLERWRFNGTMIFDPKDSIPLKTKGQTVLSWADATGSTLTWSTGILYDHEVAMTHEEGMVATFEMQLNGKPA